ncbi:MAG: DNA polymerase IV, partial [Thioalkalivibrio sp.]|nr:DNA polymerase IV [Thioalkalivibrio sp.]
MDAFYASVDLLRYPELRGRPVVIGGRRLAAPARGVDGQHQFERLGDYRGRGVVTTATYEARTFGVHSGMGLMKAGQLAPDAVLLPADFDAYRSYSRQFKAVVRSRVAQVEDRSIDELFIDLTEVPGEPVATAREIRDLFSS